MQHQQQQQQSSNRFIATAIGSWADSIQSSVHQLTVRKYNVPDKNVASQILMYRQLLHTKCKIGLKLSRDYQGTPAQKAVLHMPWWSEGILQTNKMIISYNNLIKRLWIHGVMMNDNGNNAGNKNDDMTLDNKSATAVNTNSNEDTGSNNNNIVTASNKTSVQQADNDDTMSLPPIPHEYWVSRLGFQQPDPVTDFRSGGVLSLAMMVWIVESCPHVYQRYIRTPNHVGDASVLPFGITSINVTDMMSKFLLLSKSNDKMDVLLSQKPFWKMFADPSALLMCQELAMDMLADVVQELYQIRSAEARVGEGNNNSNNNDSNTATTKNTSTTTNHHHYGLVSVFDFSHILSVTEKRVEYDLLGSGPTTVMELRQIHSRLKIKYDKQLQQKLNRINSANNSSNNNNNNATTSSDTNSNNQNNTNHNPLINENKNSITPQKVKNEVMKQVTGIGAVASNFTGTVLSKMKSPMSTNSDAIPTNVASSNNNEVEQQQQQVQSTSSASFIPNKLMFPTSLFGGLSSSSGASPQQYDDKGTTEEVTFENDTASSFLDSFCNSGGSVAEATTTSTAVLATNNTATSTTMDDIDFLFGSTAVSATDFTTTEPNHFNLPTIGGDGHFSIGDEEEDLL